jgi:hypothetical protein
VERIVVQVGFDRQTNEPLYQIAVKAGGSQQVYKTATGRKNDPRSLAVCLAEL